LVSANVRIVSAPGVADWLLPQYELSRSGGPSLQVFTEDGSATGYLVRAVPTLEGAHRLRIDGEPAGARTASVNFFDAAGVVGQVGPFSIPVTATFGAPEVAPVTTLLSTTMSPAAVSLTVGSNGPGAEFSWRLASLRSVDPWTPWSSATTITVGGL